MCGRGRTFTPEGARGSFAHRRMCGAVLSLSRERTKGRPVAAKPRQHHGCPRTPRRLAWGWNLLLREANCFLAGAAWSGFRCHACCPLAAGRHRWAALVAREVVGPLAAPAGAWFLCTSADVRGCSFPLAGKNQRATGGSQIETAPWLPPDPSSLGLGVEPPAARGYSLPRGGGLERLGVLCLLSAGGRAAPAGRPRCVRVGELVGRFAACQLAWRDRSETVRFSASVHGRRSRSSLRRPP